MKKSITITTIAVFCCAILLQAHVFESLVAFWLVGAVPGTNILVPPVVMLTVVFVAMWLVFFHTVIEPQIKLRSYRKKSKSSPKLVKKNA